MTCTRHQWQKIETAPRDTRIMLWGGGASRFGYMDDVGNWRGLHHRPFVGQPTHWMPLPEAPGADAANGPSSGGCKCCGGGGSGKDGRRVLAIGGCGISPQDKDDPS